MPNQKGKRLVQREQKARGGVAVARLGRETRGWTPNTRSRRVKEWKRTWRGLRSGTLA